MSAPLLLFIISLPFGCTRQVVRATDEQPQVKQNSEVVCTRQVVRATDEQPMSNPCATNEQPLRNLCASLRSPPSGQPHQNQ